MFLPFPWSLKVKPLSVSVLSSSFQHLTAKIGKFKSNRRWFTHRMSYNNGLRLSDAKYLHQN